MSAYRESISFRFTGTLNLQGRYNDCGSAAVAGIKKDVLAYAELLGLKNSSNHVMATFVGNTIPCPWAGLGEVGQWGTNPAFTWTRTDHATLSTGVWLHELGHNLGLPHANSCLSGYVFTYLRACQDMEYGNTVAMMGGGNLPSPFTPKELQKVGWLPENNVATWDFTTRTYELQNFARTEAGITALKIPAISSSLGDIDFWLQYSTQAQTYYKTWPATVVGSGLLVTFDPSDNYRDAAIMRDGAYGSRASLSYICDLTPNVNNPYVIEYDNDPRLLVGQTWTEPRGRYSVRVDAVTAEKATVTISSLVPVLAPPSIVTAVQDPNGTASINFSWSPLQVTMGSIEPLEWVAGIAEDPTKTCRGNSIEWQQCSITGLARGSTYTPQMMYSTGAVVSSVVSGAPLTISQVAPIVNATSATTEASAQVTIAIDDGGSPLYVPTILTLEDGQKCQIADASGGTCEFIGLLRNRKYGFVVTTSNAIGTRESSLEFQTKGATPDPPLINARFEGSDLVISVSSTERDKTNVESFLSACQINKRRNFYPLLDLEPGISSTQFVIPNARKKLIDCTFSGYSSSALKSPYGTDRRLQVLTSGRIILPRLSASLNASSRQPGVVVLRWKVTDKNGKVMYLSVKTSKKACNSRGRTSCTIRGLESGTTFVAIVEARGPSGGISERVTVVVK